MSDFRTYVYITDQDGGEVEVEVRVFYDATYQRERISGPPEDCYPAYGEMILNECIPIGNLPVGITDEMVLEAFEKAEERMTEEAWEDYFSRGIDAHG